MSCFCTFFKCAVFAFFPKDVSSQGSSENCLRMSHRAYQYVSIQYARSYVSIQCVSIQKVYISRNGNVCECKTYINTYPFNTQDHTYPFNTYPFKRYASAGMAMYVNAKHILAYHCISRNGNEYEYHCMSFHTIATRPEWQ